MKYTKLLIGRARLHAPKTYAGNKLYENMKEIYILMTTIK